MANIKELIQSIESTDSSFDEKLAVINEMQDTLIAMKEHEEEVIDDNVELIIEALRTIEAKVEAKLRIIPEKGEQGIQGQKGEQGDRGLDGAQGRDGKSGLDGKNGLDGKDGISVQDAKIDFDGSLVITLSDGREINVGEVVPVDVAQTIHKIQSGSGGDSQTVLDAIAALQATIATYGTMALQNATSVAITGGTINNTTIGATTPATGVFTTLTAQTEVLKGTGQNFLTFSQTFQNAVWFKQTNVTATDNATTAPDGTATAASIAWGSASNGTGIYEFKTGLSWTGISNTKSIYVRADVAGGTVALQDAGFGGSITTLTLSTSWQRITLTESVQTNATGLWIQKTASSPATIYLWGGQIELGSTANTYIPTTTTAVYGTPTLSFSGVSTIGLESNGSLFLQPAGTGALQAQATTSSAVGGNVRGANAVDWQTNRNAGAQVASQPYSVISGGTTNTANGFGSAVVGGTSNTSSNNYSFVGAGALNAASGIQSSVVGGWANTASGYFGFVGNGFTNSTTSNSAVTTQSSTMNGTTAVTLAASNANIKVGQYITGTSIAADTYVAAISGTSLTLSKVASGSSTSTLSFFTPHGVVVGGGNNTATGSYSFIGGGGDAGTAGNRNVASGDWSVVGGGSKNVASGIASVIAGGGVEFSVNYGNTASGSSSFIGGGILNIASAAGSTVSGGWQNQANGSTSTIVGGRLGFTRAITGNTVIPANNDAFSGGTYGMIQTAVLALGRQTTDATATRLTSDASSTGSTTNQVIMPNNSAYFFTGEVVAGVTGGGNTKGWTIEGVIKRGANAASTALVGTPTVTSTYADAGASTWVIAVTADTTNGGLAVTFTGQAATTIRTVAQIRTTEMTY
jgi:hypothetical protein